MKVILVDDEPLALQYLERQLKKLDQLPIEIVGTYMDASEGRKEILAQEVDIVFLDISLSELSGIELAEQLLERKPYLCIVFVSGYHEYAVHAFELNAVDYLVKPVQMDRLAKTMKRLQERIAIRGEKPPVQQRPLKMTMFRQVMIEHPHQDGQYSLLQWRTSKAQELFIYLLQHRGQLVRKSILIDLLWTEFDMDKAYPQLYTAIYHIRKTLEPYNRRLQITNTTEGYVLNMENIQLDIEVWEEWLAASPAISAKSIDRHIEVLNLYTGDYLQEYDYWWAESERQRYKRMWLGMSYSLADWYFNHGRMEEALFYHTSITKHHPLEERAYYSLMQIYALLNNGAQVHLQYSIMSKVLKEEMNVEPSSYITEWYEQWKQGGNTIEIAR